MIVQLIKKNKEIIPFPLKADLSVTNLKNEIGDDSFIGGFLSDYQLADIELEKYLNQLTEELNIPFFKRMTTIPLEEQLAEAKEKYEWRVSYFDYPKGKEEYSIESLLTIGNGFFGLRGTTPEMSITDSHYPGTYMAGVFNTVSSNVEGTTIENEDFVNLPNSQKLYLIVNDEVINFEDNQVEFLKRELDLRTGELVTTSQIFLGEDKKLDLKSKKIVSMRNRHFYSLSYSFKLNFVPDTLYLVSELDGDVYNYNVERYRKLNNQHLTIREKEVSGKQASLLVETNASKIAIYQESQLSSSTISLEEMEEVVEEKKVKQIIAIDAFINEWQTIEKTVYLDKGDITYPELEDFLSYEAIYQASKKEWEKLWDTSAIEIQGDLMSQKMLNLHTYHILVSASPNGNKDLDASIGARGLHGEAYRGHIFWDELFILPFYTKHFPETAKQLLMYRYERLEMAKQLATEEGHQGAMYPWQSGLDGREQSQKLHLNPLSGEWKEDHSRRQRHVSLAIAYNIWQYFEQTNDVDFLTTYGLDMLIEITKFWVSLTSFNEKTQRYDIKGVMGPDEFHEAYSNSEQGGLNNNAYTNLMVAWLFEWMIELSDQCDRDLELSLTELDQIRKKLKLDINQEGIIAQFEGYFDLKEIDWADYRKKYGNIYRMDRILNAEGKSADDYKVAKQADSLMIFYNLTKDKVSHLLAELGYELPEDYIERNLLYYLKRTSHGSTLSRVVHCQLAEMVGDRDLAWQLYQEALYSDYNDIQGGTTAEGIHTGVMAATLNITLSSFAGLDLREKEIVTFEPHMPEKWQSMTFKFKNQDCFFKVRLTHNEITIQVSETCSVQINGKVYQLAPLKNNVISY